MIFDISIIGNGIVGSMSAFKLSKEFKNKKIAFISPPEREGSASIAAGAMLNVLAEVDYGIIKDNYQERKIRLGIAAQENWDKLIKKYKIFKNIKTADDTIVYLSKNATTLEKKCFKRISYYVNKFNRELKKDKKTKLFKKQLKFPAKTISIKGEGAIDTRVLFKILDKEIHSFKNVNIFGEKCLKISKIKNNYELLLSSKKKILTKKVLLASGSYVREILGNLGSDIQDTFYGVGTALSIKSNKKDIKLPKRTVIRTPNRGSTCGVHYVPRLDNNFYVGAGSFISKKPIFEPRAATLEYLLGTSKKEFLNSFGKGRVEVNIGFRPMSFDGKPLIGSLKKHKNIFIVSGTKRDGLTYCTEIIKTITSWCKEKNDNIDLNTFIGWEPERKPISYINKEFAINAYIENKLAGLLEHKETNKNEKTLRKELFREANLMHKKIVKKYKLSKNFGVHPEILNVI